MKDTTQAKVIGAAAVCYLLASSLLAQQSVQVPVPPVTPPPVAVIPKVTNMPNGCTQGTATWGAGNVLTIPLNCGGPPPISVSVKCNPATVVTGGSSACTASVSGTSNQNVTWSASAGSISSAGVFTAPGTAQTVTVAAASVADPSKTGSTPIVVTSSQSACVTGSGNTIKPTGGVDNSNWTAKISAAGGAAIEVCPGSYNLQPLWISNAHLQLDDGVTVNDTTGYSAYSRMINVGSNVTIEAVGPNKAAGFTMPFSYASNIGNSNQDTNQYKHCIFPDGNALNVVLSGFWATKCGGDGISVNNANVTINNVTSSGNIRNGGSFTGSGTVTVNGGTYKGNVNFAKSGIADGWDAEMNGPGSVQHMTFNNVNTSGNGQDGVCLCIGAISSNPSNPSTYVFNNHNSSGNGTVPPPSGLHGGAPYRFRGWPSGWKGSIKVNNSIADGKPFTYSYPPDGQINPN